MGKGVRRGADGAEVARVTTALRSSLVLQIALDSWWACRFPSSASGSPMLTVLFTLTDAPLQRRRFEAVHRASKDFELMSLPFFILAGNFMTHGGVARRMIRVRDPPWSATGRAGWGLAAVVTACAIFAAFVRIARRQPSSQSVRL